MESYHGDNSRFDSKEFQDSCKLVQQTFSYHGVGAHHQNVIAENVNKCISHLARTSSLHAIRSGQVSSPLPYGFLHTSLRRNATITWIQMLMVFHPLSTLQTGTGIGPPKWDTWPRVGVYLGHFLVDAGNIALVLNLQTGHVSPQYHVVFDDKFTTVPYRQSNEEQPNWATIVAEHSTKSTEEAFTIAFSWYEGEETHNREAESLGEMKEQQKIQ
eukprot:11368288-Ditylum_brightwellii.AAC.1